MSALPTISTRIAFGVGPRTVPTGGQWFDATSYLLMPEGISITRGRDDEFNAVRTGTCTFTLLSLDRRFEPAYASSPHYPYVRPMQRVEIYATYSGTDYRLFTGFIEQWKPVFTLDGLAAVRVTASDAFKRLARRKIPSLFLPSQLTGARIAAILDWIGWPAGDRMTNLSTTGTTLVLGDPDYEISATALEEIKTTSGERGEFGVAFMSRDGKLTFQDRNYRLTPAGSPATFGDDQAGGEYGYAALEMSMDDRMIFNHALVKAKAVDRKQTITLTGATGGATITPSYKGKPTAALAYNISTDALASALGNLKTLRGGILQVTGTPGSEYNIYFNENFGTQLLSVSASGVTANVSDHSGTVQEAFDLTSMNDYDDLMYQNGEIEAIVPSDAAASSLASAIVRRYKDPRLRFDVFKPKVYDTPAGWPTVLGADVGTYVRGRRRYGSGTLEANGFVEGISIKTDGIDWDIDWQVSPADPTQYFTFGNTAHSTFGGSYGFAP